MTEVVLEDLCMYFGNVKAVDNLNMKAKDKEFTVLLGPSGCGKTTTLRLIAGLEKPMSGNIYFDDEIVNDLEPKERNIAMVFQEYALYPHMSVFNNMALCLKIDKFPKDEIVERVKKTARILRIEELLDRKPGQLSGGQMQRVALGRAIIRNPTVYLLDEPLSNLDAKLRIRMRAELKKLHEKLKTTTIYVTHDQSEAMVIADSLAVMKDGKLLQIDRPRQIYDHPANRFIAEFVGSPRMNLVESSLLEKDGEIYLDVGVFSLKVPNDLWGIIREQALNSELLMGIRPEHISVYAEPKEGYIEAKVYFFQQMGNVGYVDLEIGTNMITAMVSPDFNQNIGEKVFVKFDERHIHIFNKSDGKAIV